MERPLVRPLRTVRLLGYVAQGDAEVALKPANADGKPLVVVAGLHTVIVNSSRIVHTIILVRIVCTRPQVLLVVPPSASLALSIYRYGLGGANGSPRDTEIGASVICKRGVCNHQAKRCDQEHLFIISSLL